MNMTEEMTQEIEPAQVEFKELETVKAKKEPAKATTLISVQSGALVPTNASELMRTIKQIADGGGFPATFDTDAKRIAAYSLANALMGARWQLALNNIAIIHGKMCIFGELPGALAEQTKEVAEKAVYVVDKEYSKICIANKNLTAEIYAAVCVIQRKGRSKKEFFYTVDEARKAGQLPAAASSPWTKHLKVMLIRKAMAQAIKFEFADAMIGTPVAEYDFDAMPDMVDVKPTSSAMEKMKDLMNGTQHHDYSVDQPSAVL